MKPQQVVIATSVGAALVCGVAALAWNYDLPALRFLQLLVPRAAPVTIALIATAALALALTRLRRRWPGALVSTLVWVGGLVVLLGYMHESGRVTGWIRTVLDHRLSSPHTAIALTLLGTAITMVSSRRRLYVRIGHDLALIALVLMIFVILAFFFGASELYTLSAGVGMSPLGAIAIVLLSFGALSVIPRFSLVRIFYLPTEGGGMARRFVPFVFGVPVLVAAGVASGLRRHWFTAEAGLALLAVCVIVVLGGVTWRFAFSVGSAESRLERLVRSRTRRLTETIAELEEFAQALAHDVRGPLINLREFLTIVRDDHAAMLPPEGRDYLQRAIRASERLDRLTLAMLRYGEISRRPFHFTKVDMDALIASTAEEMKQSVCSGAVIRVAGPLIPVWADETGLKDVFRELLKNACRFTRPGVPPAITVTSMPSGTLVRLLVQDEGVGIKPQYQKRIFHPFEQLARVHEHTGIGLALVRRAVTKMNGRAGVVSDGYHGSTFWIELPRPPAR